MTPLQKRSLSVIFLLIFVYPVFNGHSAGVPKAMIIQPEDKSVFNRMDGIALQGRGFDIVNGLISEGITENNLLWTSSKDGHLGAGSNFIVTLSPGTHVITLTATDSAGISASSSVTISIE